MIALDTNILVRWLLRDDAEQAAKAQTILAGACWLGDTVLLELAWVLKSYAGLERAGIADSLETILLLPELQCPDREATLWAIEAYRRGADIADSLHIVSSRPAENFATFDRDLVRKMKDNPFVEIRLLD